MTEFVIELVRLHGDEQWAGWGAQWADHADVVGNLPSDGPGGWRLIDHFRDEGREATQLDWGSLLYPVSKEELIDLYSPDAELRPRQASAATPSPLSELAEDDHYGLVVIEC